MNVRQLIHSRCFAYLYICAGYDGVDELFPSLLELIQDKISGGDIPSFSDQTADTTQQSHGDTDAETVCVTLSTSSLPTANADNITANMQQSLSATKWYCFSSGFCSEHIKSPTSRSQLENPRTDVKGTVEHAVTVNGFTEHWRDAGNIICVLCSVIQSGPKVYTTRAISENYCWFGHLLPDITRPSQFNMWSIILCRIVCGLWFCEILVV